jgi:hypothetical protein
LNFVTTRDWHGEPHGREGQAFSWQAVDTLEAIRVEPLLPALLHDQSDVLAKLQLRAKSYLNAR